ncbi:MAG: hypothetical protein HY900_00395 [Deltaproteobacteria bacterium]|nr:hypothetical protein [Deltaproteobacteria bacterium]
MVEFAAAVGVAIVVAALGAAGNILPAERLLLAAAALICAGLAGGGAAGIAYHAALHRALTPLGALPRGWWWRPTSLHDRIPPGSRPRVMLRFHAGVAGFLVTLAGCALLLVGALAM